MKKQSGFTLIELVIVIIILGILAATAVPKFVDLQGDARQAAMKGLKGALEGAATLTYSKAAIDGFEKLNTEQVVNGVATTFGYPSATSAALGTAAGLAGTDWTITDGGDATAAVIVAEGAPSGADESGNDAECRVTYLEATSIARPTITVHDEGC
ncbi:prepilin-type N-terminal cleavage/methylation domain-containing protein [Psychromonas ossibalaenae]|uniref:prepilin-type N-terminal cleavage/methylation domain-containing protein n=1 Tax=Psychromonas ossibalaenae TaxID=444922 RepID=UPI00036D3052|nr:prepilin-type N-terminal cleavage/methylation domain-containing protein [Psychromonas ossibalaenae]